MGVACCVLHGHFGPVYLHQVSKNVASGNNLALEGRAIRVETFLKMEK